MSEINQGGNSDDSERIRILPTTSDANHRRRRSSDRSAIHVETTNNSVHSRQLIARRASSNDANHPSSSTSLERNRSSTTNDEFPIDDQKSNKAFHNAGFSLSPSDLEKSWDSIMKSRNVASQNIEYNGLKRVQSDCKISIHRDPLDHLYIGEKYGILPSETTSQKASRYVRSRCNCSISCFLSFITSVFPILSWLPKYRLEYLIPDVIAGFTISILHIPQGMAYGILASVKAENGLYVSFFPVLVYFFLGTSRHISIGTFAVISLMLSSSVSSLNAVVSRNFNSSMVNQNMSNKSAIDLDSLSNWPPTHLEVVTSMAIAVGFWQLFMGIFRLGSLTVVLSDQLVSGFSTGAAVHVATSQLKDLFGIRIGRYSGPLKLIYMYRDIFENLVNTNGAAVIISGVTIFILAVFKEQIHGRLKGKLKIQIPIDLIVVVLATTASYFGMFHERYNVSIMKDIPTGLPSPVPPRFDLLLSLVGDSFAIAVVAFAISLSMAKLFSKKHKYPVSPNQELLALGCANVFSSFFACYPCSASLSRSLVQEQSGGKTQVAGVVSCCILLIVLLVLAPMFYTLPKCILSCIILVALKGMFMQVRDCIKAWKISKLDASIWLVTFLSTVLLDVSYGLLVGVVYSIMSVIFRTAMPSRTFLGRIPGTDIYLDVRRYDVAQEVKGVKIFHFESALYFMNRELFKSSLQKHVPLEMRNIEETPVKEVNEQVHRIIIDCSTFSFVDMSGLETLLEIMRDYKEAGISVFLSGCSIAMHDVMEKSRFFENVPQHPSIFPTIHDAVEFHYLPHTSTANS